MEDEAAARDCHGLNRANAFTMCRPTMFPHRLAVTGMRDHRLKRTGSALLPIEISVAVPVIEVPVHDSDSVGVGQRPI